MTQETQTRQSIEIAGARVENQAGIPGLWPSAAVAVLCGIVCWFWLISGVATTTSPAGSAQAVVSELAPVDDQDLPAALTTMSGSADFLAQFKQRTTGCRRPLAWVSLVRAPGQPPGTVRLRSGAYFSPIINLSDEPVRLAIPYPGPYETGHGTLAAMDAGGGARIALRPTWNVPAQNGDAAREVTWRPSSRCDRPDG